MTRLLDKELWIVVDDGVALGLLLHELPRVVRHRIDVAEHGVNELARQIYLTHVNGDWIVGSASRRELGSATSTCFRRQLNFYILI